MRKLVYFTLGFGVACACGAYLFRGTYLLAIAILCLLGLAAAWILRDYPVSKRLAAVFLGTAIGCFVFRGYDAYRIEQIRQMDGQIVEITFHASSYSWETDYGAAVDGTVQLDGKSYRVRLYLNENMSVTPGDDIVSIARLRLTDEGGANEPTFHRTNGILALAYQTGELILKESEPLWRDLPGVWRQKCLDILDRALPEDAAGFVKALLLAYKVDLTYEQSADFSVTGISHIVAVSGLHVSILFALVYQAAGKRRYLTALIGIPCVLVFAAMAGFTPSVTRAAIMQILMMLALVFNREYDPPTALAFAALVLMIANPLVIASVGFQLSFASVAGIFLFAGKIRQWILDRLPEPKKKKSIPARLRRWLAGSISVTLSATVMTTPLVAYYYGVVSLVGILTNLLVLPVISGIFYCGMAMCAIGLFSPGAAAVLGWIGAWPVRYVLAVAETLARVPLAAVYTESSYVVIWLVFCYVLLVWLLIAKHKRPLISFCCAGIGLSIALLLSWAEQLLDDYRVTVLDVGQGQCIILQSEGYTFLVDCGGDYSQDAGETAGKYLLSQGISRIDGLILTHMDEDHVGGAAYLSYWVDIDRVYLATGSESPVEDSAVFEVSKNMEISFGEAKILVFAPLTTNSGNESSLAVLFTREKYDTLITGDLSAFWERQLIASNDLPDLEVLIAGHHGSKTSTCQELLDATAPDVVMVSVGADNSYGHPADEVIGRLESFGCGIYRTDEMGTLIYRR